jgi:hypothetical protein
MIKMAALCFSALALCACVSNSNIRVTNEASPSGLQAKARSEPVYYNGKTYQFGLQPEAGGAFNLTVEGMTATQQKDAVAVATSSLRYFACPDKQTGKLETGPRYEAGRWLMRGRCA